MARNATSMSFIDSPGFSQAQCCAISTAIILCTRSLTRNGRNGVLFIDADDDDDDDDDDDVGDGVSVLSFSLSVCKDASMLSRSSADSGSSVRCTCTDDGPLLDVSVAHDR